MQLIQVVVALAVVVAVSARVFISEPTHQKYMWESFKNEYNKRYDTFEEEVKRFGIFIENLKIIDARNEAEAKVKGTAIHGINKFTDLSQDEFKGAYLKADKTMKTGEASKPDLSKLVKTTETFVDWTGVYTTPVKDQGYCGSCWAFSATEQIESDTIRTLSTTVILSPEQITQCAKLAYGCSGGWTEVAYGYVKKNGGIETDADYPYTSYYGRTGTCSSDTSKSVVTVSSYFTITTGEADMASYVQSTGPLSVCVDASSWSSYTGGIMSVCGTSVDHCVQAVGVYPASTDGYWKVRNSWGTSWGESGYIQLAYGADTCAITNDPTYTTVALV